MSVKDEVAEELRRKTGWITKTNSSRNSSISSPRTTSASDLFHGRRDSIYEEDELMGANPERSREDYLHELLMGSSELTDDSQRLPDFDLGDPPLGFMP